MLDLYFPYYLIAFFLTLTVTVVSERRLIPALRRTAAQPIYEGGPAWHAKKSGTPTMGGIGFLIAFLVLATFVVPFLISKGDLPGALSFLLAALFAVGNAAVGLIDDLTKIRHRENAGLTPIEKLIAQTVLAALFLFLRRVLLGDDTVLRFFGFSFDAGVFYYPLSLVILVGIVNCANLTDGIDGLAASVAFSVGVSLFYLSASLDVPVSFLSAALLGMTIGFLFFNVHPARVFMGDTGSLFFGALAVSSAFSLGNPLIALPSGIVYVIEGISVIVQVFWYKLTKRRVFLMAPIHHHLEKSGWSENRICLFAVFLTLLCAVPVYLLFLPV